MPGALRMSREEMAAGFAVGRSLIQEEWANPQEIAWVDELVAEEKATATAWQYHTNYQCERRRVSGVPSKSSGSGPDVTNHGSKSDLHPEYVTPEDGTKSGYKSDLHPGYVPPGGDA